MEIDQQLFLYVYNLAGNHRWLDTLMVWVASFYPHLLITAGMVGIITLQNKTRKIIIFAFLAASLAYILNFPIRQLFFRPRPFLQHPITPLIETAADKSSFASNHAASSFAFANFISLKKKRVGLLFIFGALAVGFSRVFVGIHYPADILGGAIIGLIAAALSSLFSKPFGI